MRIGGLERRDALQELCASQLRDQAVHLVARCDPPGSTSEGCHRQAGRDSSATCKRPSEAPAPAILRPSATRYVSCWLQSTSCSRRIHASLISVLLVTASTTSSSPASCASNSRRTSRPLVGEIALPRRGLCGDAEGEAAIDLIETFDRPGVDRSSAQREVERTPEGIGRSLLLLGFERLESRLPDAPVDARRCPCHEVGKAAISRVGPTDEARRSSPCSWPQSSSRSLLAVSQRKRPGNCSAAALFRTCLPCIDSRRTTAATRRASAPRRLRPVSPSCSEACHEDIPGPRRGRDGSGERHRARHGRAVRRRGHEGRAGRRRGRAAAGDGARDGRCRREVLPVRTDVAQPADIEALAERAWSAFGAVHVLCNNAGVSGGAARGRRSPPSGSGCSASTSGA